jgi:hypothetical protein
MAYGQNHIGTIAGKLNGVMAAKTPIGWRTYSQSMPEATSSSAAPIIRVGMPQACSTFSMPRRTEPRDSSSVLPFSRVTIVASSSKWASSRPFRANRQRARTTGGVARQRGNAASAACTAASTSVAPESGTRPNRSPVAGFVRGRESVARDGTQAPPTKLGIGRSVERAAEGVLSTIDNLQRAPN